MCPDGPSLLIIEPVQLVDGEILYGILLIVILFSIGDALKCFSVKKDPI